MYATIESEFMRTNARRNTIYDKNTDHSSSEITLEQIYRQRRRLMISIGTTLLGTGLAACAKPAVAPAQPDRQP